MTSTRRLNGAGVRAIRELTGVSLRDLATAIDTTPGYLSKLETGKQQPSAVVMVAIARRLNVTIDAITYGVSEVAA